MDGLSPISVPVSDFYPNVTMNISFVDSQVMFFGVPLVAGTGLVLNAVVLVLTFKYHLLNKLCSPLVTLLCVSDAGFLLVLLLTWTGKNYVNIYHVSGVCQIAIFTSHMFGFISNWMVVSLCIMALVSLTHPGKFLRRCTPTATRLLVSVFGVFIFAGYLYKTWTYDTIDTVTGPFCAIIPENKEAMRVLSTIDVLLIVIAPCLVIFIVQFSLMIFVLTSSCRKDDDSVTLDVVKTASNTSLKEKNVETSYCSRNDKDSKGNGSDLDDSDNRSLELLNLTSIFMEPCRSVKDSAERGPSVSWENWVETKATRVSQMSRLSLGYSDVALSNWKNTMAFSLFFMCLVLPGAVENIVFMQATDNVVSNLEIYSSSTHQFFQLMFYCHFALDGFVYVGLSRTFWKKFRTRFG